MRALRGAGPAAQPPAPKRFPAVIAREVQDDHIVLVRAHPFVGRFLIDDGIDCKALFVQAYSKRAGEKRMWFHKK